MKLHLEGRTPLLINADMNLSSENVLAYLQAYSNSTPTDAQKIELADNLLGK